ncbi:MAG: DUF1559 domain-containing protein [Pirellulales bacterium]|nr:DUF1559 domain-containing protein [Pirellulales bacterium]
MKTHQPKGDIMSEDERGQTDSMASDSIPPTDQTHPPADCQPGPGCLGFWFIIWLGTTLSGGIFGHIATGDAVGVIGGVILAGFFALPMLVFVAVITRFMWLERFRVVMAGLGGCATGILATHLTFKEFDDVLAYQPALLIAGCFGALGAFAAAGVYYGLFGRRRETEAADADDRPVTARNILMSIIVVIVLISACAYVSWAVYAARQAYLKNQCSFNLKQIGLALHNYAQVHKCLPPAYLTDEAGKPLLS